MGYATADSPLGPWHKHPGNPVLSQNATLGMYSTGHGSIVASPDGSQLYYVHHGRPTATTPDRRLYTERLVFDAKHPDADGNPALRIEQSTADEPIPSGVAPYAIDASASAVSLSVGGTQQVGADVRNADGGSLALANPLNRVTATIADPSVASLSDATGAGVTVHALRAGHTWLRLTYQRERADGSYATVRNQGPVRPGPVTVTVPITVLAGP
ncbi:family 43 glycosylhydrolase [Actinocatenispora sera]|uniref:Glycosyl hydrolase family 43 n=1 Tax=Actinocatenispora sera TaxID=390989 RepID=A0A810KUN9_9ACTN|nr:family 43 glycosylhydrolase [Actinocatenispora sera]BCJ26031.1 hypothetical protein Asera_01390 [Actinocatenispora sera]